MAQTSVTDEDRDPSLFVFGQSSDPTALAAQARNRLSGLYHGSRVMPVVPVPGEPIRLCIESGASACLARVHVRYTTRGSTPDASAPVVEARKVEARWDDLSWNFVDRWEAVLPPLPEGSRVRYIVQGTSEAGAAIEADAGEDQATLFGFNVGDSGSPTWIRDAVIYQIFVDRFRRSSARTALPLRRADDVYGGDLDGILEALDYLSNLGVNTLWLTPIFEAETYHRYDALDYERVAASLGGEAALRRLVDAAHQRDIRMLLDLAPNHCSWHNPRFLDAQHDSESLYRDWFRWRHWPDEYHSFVDATPYLPQLNTRNPEVVSYFGDVARHYLSAIGVDGFRLDHAIGPPLLFWSDFRASVRAAKPDAYTVGEATVPPGEMRWYQGRLDGCLDFPLLAAFRRFFIHRSLDAPAFHALIARNDDFYDTGFSRPTFLDNHDMNRFLWAAGGDVRVLKLAAVCQFGLQQPPIIYYGTEAGLSQVADVEVGGFEACRLPMDWDGGNEDLLAFYRALIHARRVHPALRSGNRTLLKADGRLLAFLVQTDGDRVAVLVNASGREHLVTLPGPGRNLLSGEDVEARVRVPPMVPALIALD
jgi:cyclomaltodextrinase